MKVRFLTNRVVRDENGAEVASFRKGQVVDLAQASADHWLNRCVAEEAPPVPAKAEQSPAPPAPAKAEQPPAPAPTPTDVAAPAAEQARRRRMTERASSTD